MPGATTTAPAPGPGPSTSTTAPAPGTTSPSATAPGPQPSDPAATGSTGPAEPVPPSSGPTVTASPDRVRFDPMNDFGLTPAQVTARVNAQVAQRPEVKKALAAKKSALKRLHKAKTSAQRRAAARMVKATQARVTSATKRAKTLVSASRYSVDPASVSGAFNGRVSTLSPFGGVQVRIVVDHGVVTSVTTPVYPKEGDSEDINARVLTTLQTAAVHAQSANVSTVSGASYTSKAFRDSLMSALVNARL